MRRLAAARAGAIAILCAAATTVAVAGQRPSLRDVVARAGVYVNAYAEQFSALVGQEEYTQSVTEKRGEETRVERTALRSEFALIQVSGNAAGWEGFRDVFEVNGTIVRDRKDRLEQLFTQSPQSALQQARTIADESARFNIGPIARNFNVPTAVLFFLHPSNQDRFKFSKTGEETVNGRPAWVVGFDERERPTLIRTPQGRSIPAKGRAWVEPDSGRILRTELHVEGFAPGVRESSATVTVDYGFDDRLGISVPTDMREEYSAVGTEASATTCVAKYSNFRRFVTEGRLIVPK